MIFTIVCGVMVLGAWKPHPLQVVDELLDTTLIQTSALWKDIHVVELLQKRSAGLVDGTDDRASLLSQELKQRHTLCARRAVQTPKTNMTYLLLICQEGSVTAIVRAQSAISSFSRPTSHYFIISWHTRSSHPTLYKIYWYCPCKCTLATVQNTKKVFFVCCNCLRSRASVVSIVARLRTGRAGVRFLVEAIDFSLLQNIGTGCGAHTASYSMVPGFFTGVKRPVCEVDHSPSYSAEVKNKWSYASLPFICLQGRVQGRRYMFLPSFCKFLV